MMTGNYLSYAAFALVCLALLTVPFIPAFREWLYPSDIKALPIPANYTSDIDHFAKRLKADVAAKLGIGKPTGYEDFAFVSDWIEDMDWGHASKRLICTTSVELSTSIRCPKPLFVDGSIRAGVNSDFVSLYATGDICLDAESEIHDWAHAEGMFSMSSNSVALRRISAGKTIALGKEVWFERLNAPDVQFGTPNRIADSYAAVDQIPSSFADLPLAVQQTPLLFLIRGDCVLPGGRIYTGSLVVTGFLTIGTGTTVIGNIKAREGLSVGGRAVIEGAITCEKRVYMFKNSRAYGPVVSESDILIGTDAVVGLPDAQTTVTARNIIVENGVLVHGTVWAHEIGMVKAA